MGLIRVPRVANGVSGFAPYQVSLVDTTLNSHCCGGVIINAFIILTAAHCFYREGENSGKAPYDMRVVAGQFHQEWPDSEAKQTRYVQDLRVHGLFNINNLVHDLGFLQLKTPLKITKFVRPIPLPIYDRLFKGNVTIYGFGLTRRFHDTKVSDRPNTLQMTKMSIISNAECRRGRINPGDVTENMGCAQSNKSATCEGDSGSPVVCHDEYDPPPPPFTTTQNNAEVFRREVLCGIVSWSWSRSPCDVDEDGELISPPPPTVFTKISSYTTLIYHALRNVLVVNDHFLCDDLQYIPQVRQCDGNKDCADGSDEGNCSSNASSTWKELNHETNTSTTIQTTTEFYSKSTTENNTTTDFDYFTSKWSIDSIPSTDLPPCNSWACMSNFMSLQERLFLRACDLSDGFLCPQEGYKCIQNHQLCDGKLDCANGFDENVDDCNE